MENSASNTQLIGLFGVVIGAVITVFVTWLNNRASEKRLKTQLEHVENIKKTEEIIRNLQELYLLIRHWSNFFTGTTISLYSVMQGEMTYDEHLDLIINTENNHDFNKIELLIEVYAPILKSRHNKVLTARDKSIKISSAHKGEYQNGNANGEKYIDPFAEANLHFHACIDELLNQLIQLIKEHNKLLNTDSGNSPAAY